MAARSRFSSLVPAVVVLLAFAACDSPSEPPGGGPRPDPTGPPQPPELELLECEIRGYPCSLAEVPLEILERSDALADQVVEKLQAGTTVAAAAAWLGEQEGMAEIQWDGPAIRFRLEGGRGTWVWEEQVLQEEIALAAPSPPIAKAVVFEGLERKRALVFSPLQWMFGSNDPGPAVAAILEDTRGYDHAIGVTFRGNPTPDLNPGGYFGWESFQVIKVTTSAGLICSDGPCRGALSAGVLKPEPESTAEQLKSEAEPGLEAAKAYYGGTVLTADDHVVVTADFFRQRYPDGVSDAVIYLTAPAIMDPHQAIDVAQALHGNNTVVLGWDAGFRKHEAAAAAVELFRNLGERGYPAQVALEEIGALRTGSPTPLYPGGATLHMLQRRGGGDLRIRDNIYLLHPPTGATLNESHRIAAQRSVGQGRNHAVPVRVFVDGVKPEFAGSMFVHVSVDGDSSDRLPLTSGEYLDDGRWEVLDLVQLSDDLTAERVARFRATVDLHDEGASEHETLATLVAEPIMGWKWELEADYTTTMKSYLNGAHVGGFAPVPPNTEIWAKATLILEFVENQDLDEPNPRYTVTEGTVTGNLSHIYTSPSITCTFIQGPFTYTWEEVADGNQWGHNSITFHTGNDPVQYTGWASPNGPLYTNGSVQCDNDPVKDDTYRPSPTFLQVESGNVQTVSEDGMTITGTYELVMRRDRNPNYYDLSTFTSRYTIRRIE